MTVFSRTAESGRQTPCSSHGRAGERNSGPGSLPESDVGAALVFVAVALVALLALAAFAVDFGRMWEERRQLQNGADAAALAIAEDCARGNCGPGYDEYAVAESYVDANARDGSAWAWNVELDMAAQTVTVHNATEDASGDNNFDMLFAGIVGFDGFTVAAEATVAWGGLSSPLSTIPIIVSDCEWDKPYWEGGAGAGAHLFAEPPRHLDTPYPNWTTDPFDLVDGGQVSGVPDPVVLTFHDGNTTEDCNAVAGQDSDEDGRLSGGFGWLDVGSDPCVAQVFGAYEEGDPPEYGWAGEDPGASTSTSCDADTLRNLLLGQTVYIPYFNDDDGLSGGGSTGVYHIAGYGAFHIVGYYFPGGQFREYSYPLTTDPCRPPADSIKPLNWVSGADAFCLVGYFVEETRTTGTIGSATRGITVIKFTG